MNSQLDRMPGSEVLRPARVRMGRSVAKFSDPVKFKRGQHFSVQKLKTNLISVLFS